LRRPPLSMMPWQTTHFSVSLFSNPRICQRIKCSAIDKVLPSGVGRHCGRLRISPAQGSLFQCHRQSAPREERTPHPRLRMIADLERLFPVLDSTGTPAVPVKARTAPPAPVPRQSLSGTLLEAEIADLCFKRKWLVRKVGSRALTVTRQGSRALPLAFGIDYLGGAS
jgi:hypothetical protein